jgi:hypothetical protein
MDSQFKAQVVFHLTGRRPADEGSEAVPSGLRPALLAPYRHLEELRYDFPVVLVAGGDAGVRSLSQVVDALLRELAAPGVAGEGMRRRVLKVEREIRRLVAGGARGRLTQLWDRAVESLTASADDAFRRDVGQARDALSLDGELAGCDAGVPAQFVRHLWSVVQQDKARLARERIGALVTRLGDILRADFMRSEAALQRPALQASFGAAHHGLFDFDAMSRLLSRPGPRGGLKERRRERIERSLSTLKAQRFFPPALRAVDAGGEETHGFSYDGTGPALEAFRARLPEMVQLIKALQVAELEVEGNYVEDMHDAIFEAFDEQAVTTQDLEFFPDYLVCLPVDDSQEKGQLTEALSSGVPIKVVVQVDDLLEESALGSGRYAFGLRGTQVASAAMSLDEVFVLQTAASNLLQLSERVQRGMNYPGPALFSIYAAADTEAFPAYLRAAAAMQSRAFPAFSYDPGAGADLATRFSLENNPQPDRDWPLERLSYADEDLQSVSEEVAFTYVDFAACEPRSARHFCLAPRAAWGEEMIPAHRWLEQPPRDPASGVPYVLAVDDAESLTRLVVDERMMRAAIRCREAWHRLQEFGGIRDSRAERMLARERQAWEEERRRDEPAAAAVAATAQPEVASVPAAQAAAAAPAVAAAEPARDPDQPYIETIRCSTCNECTQLNPRMFAYNENKQAYIADLKAGSYKELVEAAESCQVSVIHPGKPWDPTEPGLEDLVERAKPFL